MNPAQQRKAFIEAREEELDDPKYDTSVGIEVWVGTHHHKHGLDMFVFDWEPSVEGVISRIEADGGRFNEGADFESIEVRGPLPVFSAEE